MAFREYLRMRRSDLYGDGNFRLLAQWGKFINVIVFGGDGVVLRNNCFSATLTTFDFVATSWLIFYELGNLTQWTTIASRTPLVTLVVLSTEREIFVSCVVWSDVEGNV